jgi:hypothetical protein
MSSFASIYARGFVRPRAAFVDLLESPRVLRHATLAVAITALTYSLVYFFLAHNGGRPTVFRPWLAIPAERYYHWNQYLHAPSLALAWVSAAGFTQIAARALGGRGSYEHTLAVLGLGLSIASWWTGLHDIVTTALGFVGIIDQRSYENAMSTDTPFRTMLWVLMTGYVIWFVLLFSKGVRVVHQLSPLRSLLAGTLGFAIYQVVFVIFNR